MTLRFSFFGFVATLVVLLLAVVSGIDGAGLKLHLSSVGRDLSPGMSFNLELRSLERGDVGDALIIKRVGTAVSLSPRICPPNDHRRSEELASRCIGSKKKEEIPELSVLLHHEGFPFGSAESNSDLQSFTLTIPPDFERGWGLLSATLFYLMGPELMPVIETVNATVLID